ncbi:SbcC/MukB-like Walker B domain-containing protein [Fusobacterium sp. MFO224]|uniref:SbcC/MukB-like Walker B domain-containing protein n=1 Tax=Fusobacterium sp. MFO224 TaxID=3378070 RepID=UPI00385552C3
MRPIMLQIEGLQSFKEKQVIDFEKLTEYGLFGIFGETGSGKSTILDAMILALFDEIPRNRIDGNKSSLLNSINESSKKMEVYYSFALGKDIYEIRRNYKRGTLKGQEIINSKDAILIKNGNILANKKTEVKSILNEEFGLDVDDFSRTVVLPQGKFNEFLKLRGKEKIKMLEKIFSLEKYGEKLEIKISGEKRHWYVETEKYKNQIIGKGEIKPEEVEELENFLKEKQEILSKSLEEKEEFDKIYSGERKLRELLDEKNKFFLLREELLKEQDLILEYKDILMRNNLGRELKSGIEDLLLLKDRLTKMEEYDNKLKEDKLKEEQNIKVLKEEQEELSFKKEKYLKEKENIFFDIEELRKINNLYGEKSNLLIKKDQEKKLENNLLRKQRELEENIVNKEKNKKELEKIRKEKEVFKEIDKNILMEEESKIKEKIEYITLAKEEKIEKENKEVLAEKLKKEILFIIEEKEIYLKEIKEKNEKLKQSFAYKLYKELKEGEPCPVCGSLTHKTLDMDNIDNSKIEREIEHLLKKKDKIIGEEGKLIERINKLEEGLNDFKIKYKSLNIELEEKIIKEEMELLKEKRIEEESKEKKLIELNNMIIKKELEENILFRDEKKLKKELNDLKNDYLELIKEISSKELEILNKYKNLSEKSIDFIEERKKFLEENQDKVYSLQSSIEGIDKIILENSNILKENIRLQEKMNQQIIKSKTELDIIIDDIHVKTDKLNSDIENSIFKNEEEIKKSIINDEKYKKINLEINNYEKEYQRITTLFDESIKLIAGRSQSIENWKELEEKNKKLKEKNELLKIEISAIEKNVGEKQKILKELKKIINLKNNAEKQYEIAEELGKKLKGRAFIEFLSVKKLKSIVYQASQRLKRITNGRYQLISDEECDFYVIDYFNEGSKRRCSTLSGGETFIVSLCLALALSNQMQLKGKVQLEFFFLDEGFGTLDEKLLDKVIESLENINREEKLKVGIITHLEELKVRIIRSLEVVSAVPGAKGSKVKII